MAKSMLHAEDSKFYGWASSVAETEEVVGDKPLRVNQKYVEALLNLPRYKNVDIGDLFAMAQAKLVYTKAAGQLGGQKIRGLKIVDRAFAIAFLIGYTKLDDPILQMPMEGVEPVQMPRFVS